MTLGCGLLILHVDCVRHVAVLFLPAGDCTDMDDAVGVVTRIDPGATRIETRSGDRLDTVYVRDGLDWRAVARHAEA